MNYETILIFASAITGKVVVCWDTDGPECTDGVYLDTLGM